jgi:hypothetical protein
VSHWDATGCWLVRAWCVVRGATYAPGPTIHHTRFDLGRPPPPRQSVPCINRSAPAPDRAKTRTIDLVEAAGPTQEEQERRDGQAAGQERHHHHLECWLGTVDACCCWRCKGGAAQFDGMVRTIQLAHRRSNRCDSNRFDRFRPSIIPIKSGRRSIIKPPPPALLAHHRGTWDLLRQHTSFQNHLTSRFAALRDRRRFVSPSVCVVPSIALDTYDLRPALALAWGID